MKNTIKQSERLEFNIGRSFSDAMAVLLVLGLHDEGAHPEPDHHEEQLWVFIMLEEHY